MRILFDQSEHTLRNKGNNALLKATAQRLIKYWPDSSLDLISVAPNLARLYFPEMNPVNPYDLRPPRRKFNKAFRFVPRFLWLLLFEFREEIWHRRTAKMLQQPQPTKPAEPMNGKPSATGPGVELNHREDDVVYLETEDQTDLINAISGYNLVVASGGGYMCDHDKGQMLAVFDRLEAANRQGVPTVMVGQGVGPMEDPELLNRARQVLPKVDLICYRNQRLGRPLLESLGVPPERMVMTGDDAIEMAFENRPTVLGTGIGVSLRVSSYTQVGEHHLNSVRAVLHQAARQRQAQLIAVPISSAHQESDITYIKQILAGYNDVSVGWQKLETPLEAIKKVGKCRLMITGTYHGAIFALAQGIPVIGLGKTDDYFNKLAELSDEFYAGCQVLRVDDKDLSDKLTAAIDQAWSLAEKNRPALLEVAARHIKLQQAAYEQLYKLVTARRMEGKTLPQITPLTQSVS